MSSIYKAFSALLSYPSEDLVAAVPAIRSLLGPVRDFPDRDRTELVALLDGLETRDLFEMQAAFVHLFDRSRTLSLNLFEHVHGESRDRGSAMVDLVETYRGGGFELATGELPDHLPVLLEFLATRPAEEARALLAEAAPVIAALGQRLERRETPYAAVMRALVALSGGNADARATAAIAAEPDDNPDDLGALDAVWTEAAVTFGPDPNAGCPQARDLLSRMDARPTDPAIQGA